MEIARVYDVIRDEDGGESGKGGDGKQAWFLVDRLWPRGVSKETLQLTGWPKELTPSPDLRKQFHSGDLGFEAFADRYRTELDSNLDAGELDDAIAALQDAGAKPPRSDAKTDETPKDNVLLLYGAKDTEQNHAIVLLEWLNGVLRDKAGN